MSTLLITGLLCITCLIVGALFGSLVTSEYSRWRAQRPRPVAEDFDRQNPINARSWEPVEVDGRTLYRLHP